MPMKLIKTTILTIIMLGAANMLQAQTVSDPDEASDNFVERQQAAQNKKLSKKQQKREKIDTRNSETYTVPVYMFSISAEFGDSMVYVTGVQEVANAQLTRKYDYLYYRSDYSYQFTEYLGNTFGASNQTTSVFFDKDKKKLVKRFVKVMKRYEADPDLHLVMITADKFHFKAVEDTSTL